MTSAMLTRRSLLRVGAAAAVATMVGLRPWEAVRAGADGHLRRSSYARLVGQDFRAGAVPLRLRSVSDVVGAVSDGSLVGSEQAFVLEFSGPLDKPLEDRIHELRHDDIGAFELFVTPVGRPKKERLYEAVVDTRQVKTAS